MKAIILAGGHATRLWPITRERAKPLLPLGGRPIIDYIVEDLSGLEEVVISTNSKFAGDFRDYVEEYERDNTRVVVEDQGSEEEKPGTIGAIIKLTTEEEIEDDLLVIGGDNYYSFDTLDFLDFCRDKNAPVNVVYEVENTDMAQNFGIVDTQEAKITGFQEKPDEPPSTLASTACYFFPEHRIDLFRKYEEYFRDTEVPEEKYLDEPGRLIEWAHERVDMYAFSFSGHWFDIGTPEGYLEAQSEVSGGRVAETAEVRGSEIGGNVVLMDGVEVVDSDLENTVVFPDTVIKESDIKDSIVDSGCEIEDMDLRGAVIGRHTKI